MDFVKFKETVLQRYQDSRAPSSTPTNLNWFSLDLNDELEQLKLPFDPVVQW